MRETFKLFLVAVTATCRTAANGVPEAHACCEGLEGQ